MAAVERDPVVGRDRLADPNHRASNLADVHIEREAQVFFYGRRKRLRDGHHERAVLERERKEPVAQGHVTRHHLERRRIRRRQGPDRSRLEAKALGENPCERFFFDGPELEEIGGQVSSVNDLTRNRAP